MLEYLVMMIVVLSVFSIRIGGAPVTVTKNRVFLMQYYFGSAVKFLKNSASIVNADLLRYFSEY